MRALAFLVLGLLAINFRPTAGQYPYDESCHWQCDPVDCDYYSNHCDYDCYEVCYRAGLSSSPATSASGLKSISSPSFSLFSDTRNPHLVKLARSTLQMKESLEALRAKTAALPILTLKGVEVTSEQPAPAPPAGPTETFVPVLQQPKQLQPKSAQPKVVRMRLMNPALRSVCNGRLEQIKVAPTREFALFEGSLKQ